MLRPSKWWYAVAGLIAGAGLAILVLSTLSAERQGLTYLRGLTRAQAPGSADVSIPSPGNYVVFLETSGKIDGKPFIHTGRYAGFRWNLIPATPGAEASIVSTPSCLEREAGTPGACRSATYAVDGYRDVALAFLSIGQPGTYRLTVQTADSNTDAPTVMTFGPDHGLGDVSGVFRGSLAFVMAAYAAIAIALLNWRIPSPETTSRVVGPGALRESVGVERDDQAATVEHEHPPEPGAVSHPRYPIEAAFEPDRRRGRLWALPVIGGSVRLFALIPHFIVLLVLGLLFNPLLGIHLHVSPSGSSGQIYTYVFALPVTRAAGGWDLQITLGGLAFFILWIPVLLRRRFPRWAVRWVGGLLGWQLRAAAFALGLTDRYPPFALEPDWYPIDTDIPEPQTSSRWWAVPVVGYVVKLVILVPHFVCLVGLAIAVILLWFVMWVPVLFTGSYPGRPYALAAGWLQWSLRVAGFQAGLTDRYPPFSLATPVGPRETPLAEPPMQPAQPAGSPPVADSPA